MSKPMKSPEEHSMGVALVLISETVQYHEERNAPLTDAQLREVFQDIRQIALKGLNGQRAAEKRA